MAVAGALPPFGNEVILPPGHLLRQHPEEHPSQLPRQQRLPGRIQTAVCIEMHQDASSITVQHRECLFSWSLACVQDLKQRTSHEPRLILSQSALSNIGTSCLSVATLIKIFKVSMRFLVISLTMLLEPRWLVPSLPP